MLETCFFHILISGIKTCTHTHIKSLFYNQWVSEKQKEFQLSSMQLLFYQAPLSATLLMFIIPFVEPVSGDHGIFSDWSTSCIVSYIRELVKSHRTIRLLHRYTEGYIRFIKLLFYCSNLKEFYYL